jgi:putative phage-type endonuclease
VKVFADLVQGTDEWLQIRKGHPTASRFSDIITAAKGDLSKSSAGYIRELIGECFCPEFQYFTGNKFTERGKELEPEAREAFAVETGLTVTQVGFCLSDDGVSGCSPDGLISADGKYVAGVEIKCPSPKVHVGYVLDGVLPEDYKQQVHGSMAVTGLNEWHFWSYFPGMRHFHLIVKRDEYTEKLATSLAAFVEQYKAAHAVAIPRLRIGKAAAESAS